MSNWFATMQAFACHIFRAENPCRQNPKNRTEIKQNRGHENYSQFDFFAIFYTYHFLKLSLKQKKRESEVFKLECATTREPAPKTLQVPVLRLNFPVNINVISY